MYVNMNLKWLLFKWIYFKCIGVLINLHRFYLIDNKILKANTFNFVNTNKKKNNN